MQKNSAIRITQNYDNSTVTTSFCQSHMFSKVSDKMAYANSINSDQTAPEGAVWSGSTLFAIPQSSLWNKHVKSKM